ncbi:putative methyltransferase-domain-containing protein [Parasitella parasitica]|nr:putative methyltransferase-domain-containing protein [Parasitella parasitica]
MSKPIKTIKRISFSNDTGTEEVHILVQEVLDAAYGCYVWPSALVLGEFVWHHRNQFKNKTILELGAGTSIPSIVIGKSSPSAHLILSDIPSILPVVRSCIQLNDLKRARILAIEWGQFGTENSIDTVINRVEREQKAKIDYILGSDTFYEPSQFENLLVSISFVVHKHNGDCKFYTTYQERSPKRSIQYLLDKWKLKCRQISKDSFAFDETKYSDNEDDESEVKVNAGTLSSVFLLEISSIDFPFAE